jgi:hypothetical protein
MIDAAAILRGKVEKCGEDVLVAEEGRCRLTPG